MAFTPSACAPRTAASKPPHSQRSAATPNRRWLRSLALPSIDSRSEPHTTDAPRTPSINCQRVPSIGVRCVSRTQAASATSCHRSRPVPTRRSSSQPTSGKAPQLRRLTWSLAKQPNRRFHRRQRIHSCFSSPAHETGSARVSHRAYWACLVGRRCRESAFRACPCKGPVLDQRLPTFRRGVPRAATGGRASPRSLNADATIRPRSGRGTRPDRSRWL